MKLGDRVRLLKKWGPCRAGSEGVITRDDDPGYLDIDIDRKPSPPCTVVDPPFPLIGVPTGVVSPKTLCSSPSEP